MSSAQTDIDSLLLSNDELEFVGTLVALNPSPSLLPPAPYSNFFIHSYISETFGSLVARTFWTSILKAPVEQLPLTYSDGACPHWYLPIAGGASSSNLLSPGPILDYLSSSDATRGPVVPQSLWQPLYSRIRELHVDHSPLCMPIFFVRQNGDSIGISLSEALEKRSHSLRDSYTPGELGGKTTTQLRIVWKGYPESKRQLQIKDETPQRNPITLGKFATHVAKSVQRFMDAPGDPESDFDPRWRVGQGGIQLEDVILIGVVHTSAGSWQPILQLAHPLTL